MIRSVIVEDQEFFREALFDLLGQFENQIEILGFADNVQAGIELVKKEKPELVFLDVEMPGGNGFDLIKAFEDPLEFKIIFTTAKDRYALQALKVSAVDYILKPYKVKDVKAAVEKFQSLSSSSSDRQRIQVLEQNFNLPQKKLALPTQQGYQFIRIEDIVRCQASVNYTDFFMKDGKHYVVSKTLKEYARLLKDFNFFRTHRSHLINMDHIEQYLKGKTGTVVMTDGASVDVSPKKKDSFLKRLARL